MNLAYRERHSRDIASTLSDHLTLLQFPPFIWGEGGEEWVVGRVGRVAGGSGWENWERWEILRIKELDACCRVRGVARWSGEGVAVFACHGEDGGTWAMVKVGWRCGVGGVGGGGEIAGRCRGMGMGCGGRRTPSWLVQSTTQSNLISLSPLMVMQRWIRHYHDHAWYHIFTLPLPTAASSLALPASYSNAPLLRLFRLLPDKHTANVPIQAYLPHWSGGKAHARFPSLFVPGGAAKQSAVTHHW